MYRSIINIYDLLDTLTLEMKEDLLEYLKADIAAEKAAPEKSYLEKQWAEIQRQIETLKYEPYIDDQVQIDEIYDICGKIMKSRKLKTEPWELRRQIIEDITENNYYDYFGVYDPMKELLQALILNDEEKAEAADILLEQGSEYMKEDGAKLYRELGRQDRYIAYLEQNLKDQAEPYAEVIDYYKDTQPDKAVKIAELAMKKCRDELTDVVIFLIDHAGKNHDTDAEARWIKSAKLRKSVNFKKVQETLKK